MKKFLKQKVLKLLPEESILEVLKGFNIENGVNTIKNTISGLAVLDNNDITVTSTGEVKLKQSVKELTIYEPRALKALQEIYNQKQKQIISVTCIQSQDIVLDMTSYESVKNAYTILSEQGYNIESDKQLLDLAHNKMIPNKKLIISLKWLGESAFPKSKIKKYKLKVAYCYDTSLIIQASMNK